MQLNRLQSLSVNARPLGLLPAMLVAIAPAPALAAGTVAGTTISNTASVTYDDPTTGNPITVPSNKVDLRVDELLNVTVKSADPGDVTVAPAATNQVLSYTVTNTGNGSEAFRLTALNAIGGDAFDPTTTSIVLDTNGNGVYDPATDTIYAQGTNDPVLAPDTSTRVFLLSTIPSSTTDGQRGQTDLRATALTGTGTPGTTFAGAGTGGGDAIVGASTAQASDGGFYLVQATTVSFVKSATVADPFGGTKSVPGSIITYTLTANVNGSGSLANLRIGDPVPADTLYEAGSLTLQGATLTDSAGDDAGEVTGASGNQAVAVRLGTVSGGGSRSVTFKVKVK